jgi:hypothetical protein
VKNKIKHSRGSRQHFRPNIPEIDAALRARVAELVGHLRGQAPNQTLSTKTELRFGSHGSLKVDVAGPNRGRVTDFEDGPGKAETPLQFITRTLHLSFPEAVRWAGHWLGRGDGAPPGSDCDGRNGQATPGDQAAEGAEAGDRDQRIERAQAIAAAARPIAGTLAERYLVVARGIPVPDVGWPAGLGFIPDYRHTPTSLAHSALILRATDDAGCVTATQAVLLTRNGAAILKGAKGVKLTRGVLGSSTVRFPARPGAEERTIVLAEGGETGLSVWLATGLQVRALLGTLNRDPGEIPAGDRVILARDRDLPDGRLSPAVEGCIDRLLVRGIPVSVATPLAYPDLEKSDFNDVIRRDGPDTVRALIAAAEPCGPQPYYPDAGLPVEVAIRLARGAIGDFFERALAWDGNSGTAPVHGVRAAAGLGKTAIALQFLARPEMAGKHINYYVPEQRLSTELIERFSATNRQQRALVIRGRGQKLPDGTPMCRKAELAEQIARLGQSVTNRLCHHVHENGRDERCEFYDTCPYVAQMADKGPAVRFLPHQYLFVAGEGLPKPDLVVIDERFWPASLRGVEHPYSITVARLDHWTQVPLPGPRAHAVVDADASEKLHRVSRTLYALIKADAFTVAKIVEAGVTAADCRFAAGCHYRLVEDLPVSPGQEAAVQRQRIEQYRSNEAMRMGRFFGLLADEIELGREEIRSLRVRRDAVRKDGEREDRIEMVWSADLKIGDVPVQVLDADLDVNIARRFLPTMADPTIIAVERRYAAVLQITDYPVSKRRLAGGKAEADREGKRRANRRRDLRSLVEVEAAQHGNARGSSVLCVSYKDVHEWMDEQSPIAGADFTHFNALRGKDRWRGVSTVIVAGRPQPSVEELERTTRALFWKDPRPIAYLKPDENGQRRLPKEKRTYRAHGIAPQEVGVEFHPDPFCAAVLQQIREAEVVQAVDRARLLHRTADRPCRVHVLTNLVLPLTVHAFSTWGAMVPGRIDRAWARSKGVLPLSPQWLARNLPDIFGTSAYGAEKTAQRDVATFLAEQKGQSPIRHFLWGDVLLAAYRTRATGGRSSHALVGRDLPDQQAALETLLGFPVYAFKVPAEQAAPKPAEAPRSQQQSTSGDTRPSRTLDVVPQNWVVVGVGSALEEMLNATAATRAAIIDAAIRAFEQQQKAVPAWATIDLLLGSPGSCVG